MAGTRLKTWGEEFLLYDDLNAEFDNILSTSDQLIGTPRTAAWDMDNYELILDADGDTSITADTDDQVDFRLGGTDLFYMKTAASADAGFTLQASDGTSSNPGVTVVSAQTNQGFNVVPKGSGDLQVNGGSMSPLAWQVYGA